ncbi:MAG: hypothetical protein HJJLKODD_00732 [Phycisphaerae bacterium]|nr:hypothetical protein [Phycisphaerae bacterium]
MKRTCWWVGLGCLLLMGCNGGNRQSEPFGKTYFLDGAGNWGFGTAEVPKGLRNAGYRGDVEVFIWTSSLNPLIDQLNILGAAEGAGKRLAEKIRDYKTRYPDKPVNVIALSAGTGVAVWACERLDDESRIDNLVLLGSSISNDYDMSRALHHIDGKVYVYYSPTDSVLSTVEVVGTIDRKTGVKSAGQIGLHPPRGDNGKIVNVPWSESWRKLGWNGGHTDATNERFVQYEIAKRILEQSVAFLFSPIHRGIQFICQIKSTRDWPGAVWITRL